MKDQIITLLQSTNRAGMDELTGWLEESGFFEYPASTRFHGSYEGGLAKHHLNVYARVVGFASIFKLDEKATYGQMPIKLKPENLIIACLLHDVCKIGAYQKTKKGDGWTNNRDKEKGHAKLSIARIKKHIELEKIEEMMIRFHMGIYGLHEFQDTPDNINGEYHLRGDHSKDDTLSKEESQKMRYGNSLSNAYFHNPICKVMYFCDELATLEEKARDGA